MAKKTVKKYISTPKKLKRHLADGYKVSKKLDNGNILLSK